MRPLRAAGSGCKGLHCKNKSSSRAWCPLYILAPVGNRHMFSIMGNLVDIAGPGDPEL